jgi:hypothetical protein
MYKDNMAKYLKDRDRLHKAGVALGVINNPNAPDTADFLRKYAESLDEQVSVVHTSDAPHMTVHRLQCTGQRPDMYGSW